ncbi:replication fork protection component Swi3-domain-containing protein [Cunninghamella echinulata]|nr:replication fork protection component Swi3-domain-containing protein [Cunninghamella echinulata]
MEDFNDILLDDYDPFAEEELNNNNNNNNNQSNQKSTTTSAELVPVNPEEVYGKRDRETLDDPLGTTLTDTPVKKKRTIKKFDHNVMLQQNGIYRLRSETPWLKFQGKGHEAEDLKKLMHYYRRWANELFPGLNFTDFSDRAIKVCSNKQCKNVLDQWREEYKFKNTINNEKDNQHEHVTGELSGMTLEDEDNINKANGSDNEDNDTSDNEDDSNKIDELEYFNKLIRKATPSTSVSTPPPPPSSHTQQQKQQDINKEPAFNSDDSDEDMFLPSQQRIKSIQHKQQQPKTIIEDSDDDEEMFLSSQQRINNNRSRSKLNDSDDDENNDIEEYIFNQSKQKEQHQNDNNNNNNNNNSYQDTNDDQTLAPTTLNGSKTNGNDNQLLKSTLNDDDVDDNEALFNTTGLVSLKSKHLSVDDFFAD